MVKNPIILSFCYEMVNLQLFCVFLSLSLVWSSDQTKVVSRAPWMRSELVNSGMGHQDGRRFGNAWEQRRVKRYLDDLMIMWVFPKIMVPPNHSF